MHAGTAAIRFVAGLVTIAAHGRAGPVATDCIAAIAVNGLVLNASVASDQAVISVAAAIGLTGPGTVIPVVGVVVVSVVSVAVIVVPVPIVIVVVTVPVDDGPVDVGVVVVVDVSTTTASSSPVTSPGTETPGNTATEAPTDKAAAPECCANRYPRAKRNPGRNGHRWRIRRHKEGCTVDDRRIVLRDINDAGIGWFNDDRLWALLHHLDLGRGQQRARGLRLGPHYLHRSHDI
jgi:hypothetical protein